MTVDTPKACEICGNSDENYLHTVPERFFGMGGSFLYQECAKCGVLELLNVPEELATYYRHLTIHTPKSLLLLAEEFELEVVELFYDAVGFHYMASEQYVKGKSFIEEDMFTVNSKDQRLNYEAMAHDANCKKRGDTFGAILRRPIK